MFSVPFIIWVTFVVFYFVIVVKIEFKKTNDATHNDGCIWIC